MKKINLYNNLLFVILIIIPFVAFPTYAVGATINKILKYYRIATIFVILFMYIHERKLSKIILAMSGFQLSFLISSLCSEESIDFFSLINQVISTIALCMFTELMLRHNPSNFFKAMYIYLVFLGIVNVYSMVKYYKVGMYVDALRHTSYYFLGYDNTTFYTVFPGLVYAQLYYATKTKKIAKLSIICSIIILLGYLYVHSVTALVVLYVWILFLLTIKFNFWNKIFNYRNCMIIVFVLCTAIVFFNFQNYFSDYIAKLGRNVTLTGRTRIWTEAIEYIEESPLIGYGLEEDDVIVRKFGINHVHNFLLDILYGGGIIALVFYIAILYISGKQIMQYDYDVSKVVTISIFIYLFASIFDYYSDKFLMFTIFIVAANMDKVIENSKIANMNKLE